mgnify:CR=1 FL=1
MIDPTVETLIPLGEVPRTVKWLPGRRGAKRIHTATLYRWAQRGLDGVRLETLKVGGTLCTTEEALKRFFAALTEADGRCAQPGGRTPTARRRAVEKSKRRLAEAGL